MTEPHKFALDEQETWLDIPGLEGIYQASSLGRIRSLDRLVSHNNSFGHSQRIIKGRILAPAKTGTKRSYLKVALWRDGIRRQVYVHHLVALAFIGVCPDDHEIHHVDGDSFHNASKNLMFVVEFEHKSAHVSGELHHNAKLSAEDVVEIRRLLSTKTIGCMRLAKMFGVSRGAIRHIKMGRSWLSAAQLAALSRGRHEAA